MKKIGESLKSFAVRKRISRPMEAAEVCGLTSKIGRENKPQFWAKSFKKGILSLEVKDAVAGQKLELQKEKIRADINKNLDREIVKNIRVKVKVGKPENG